MGNEIGSIGIYPNDEGVRVCLAAGTIRHEATGEHIEAALIALAEECRDGYGRANDMTHTVKVLKEMPVTHIIADFGVRYWEDAEVNGVGEKEGDPTIPFAVGDNWRIVVELATGRIEGWPKGVVAKTHYKVCDAGVYTLLDQEGEGVVKKVGYVPDMFCPEENGYGDYVIMNIDSGGFISGFEADLDYFSEEH